MIVNTDGTIASDMSYDAWGRRRNPTDWTFDNVPASQTITRGYTGQEHLDCFGLINMNGRIYDPLLGQFLSPDPFVQDPTNTQSYNRYAYCQNNPLKYTDPSGWNVRNFGNGNGFAPAGSLGNGSGYEYDIPSSTYIDFSKELHKKNSQNSDGSYYYSDGAYFNSAGYEVDFSEVMQNYVIPNSTFEDSKSNVFTRKLIAKNAYSYIRSSDWALGVSKGDYGPGDYKCNLFVYEVTEEEGAGPGLPNEASLIGSFLGQGPYPPTAGQWGNPDYYIPEWRVLNGNESPQAGDVVAIPHSSLNATGHVGIVYQYGQTISVNGNYPYTVIKNNWGFRTGQKAVFRRYTGNGYLTNFNW